MRTSKVVRTLAQAAFIGTLASGFAAAQTPQLGTITGRVTDAANGQPVAAAQVVDRRHERSVRRRPPTACTRFVAVNPGSVQLRVLRVGFAEMKQTVTVTAGQTVTANIQMRAVAATLAPVVTTATGDQRRVEVGNAIAQVDAAKIVETQAVTNMGDLLVSNAAGVHVFEGTQTGAGTRVRVRGTSSLSLVEQSDLHHRRRQGRRHDRVVHARASADRRRRVSATSTRKRSRTSRSSAVRRRRRCTEPTPRTASSSSRRSAASPARRSSRTTPSSRRSTTSTTTRPLSGAGAPARLPRRRRARRTRCSASSVRSRRTPASRTASRRTT